MAKFHDEQLFFDPIKARAKYARYQKHYKILKQPNIIVYNYEQIKNVSSQISLSRACSIYFFPTAHSLMIFDDFEYLAVLWKYEHTLEYRAHTVLYELFLLYYTNTDVIFASYSTSTLNECHVMSKFAVVISV